MPWKKAEHLVKSVINKEKEFSGNIPYLKKIVFLQNNFNLNKVNYYFIGGRKKPPMFFLLQKKILLFCKCYENYDYFCKFMFLL